MDQSLYGMLDPESMQMTPLSSLQLRVFEGELEKLAFSIGDELSAPLQPEILGKWVVSPVLGNEVIQVGVVDLQSKDVTAQLFLVGANQVSTRLAENTLTVADNLGRVIVIDLRRNCSLRNFRL